MSSDEEVRIDTRKEYHIRPPAWRSDAVTGWLRVFDILYTRARFDGILGDQRGALPHVRVRTEIRSTSPRFVTRLPENAYDKEWLSHLADYKTTLRPQAIAPYYHTSMTLQYFEFLLSAVICVLILLQACVWYHEVAWGYTGFIVTCSLSLLFIVAVYLLLTFTHSFLRG